MTSLTNDGLVVMVNNPEEYSTILKNTAWYQVFQVDLKSNTLA